VVIGFGGYLCRENVAIWGVGDLTNWARAKEEADSSGKGNQKGNGKGKGSSGSFAVLNDKVLGRPA